MRKLSVLLIACLILGIMSGCSPQEGKPPAETQFDFEKEFSDPGVREYARLFIGKKAPGFTVTTMGGEQKQAQTFVGENYVIEFAETTCDACTSILPVLATMKKEYPTVKNLYVYPNATEVELIEYFLTNDIVMDENTVAGNGKTPLLDTFKIKYTPTILFVNKEGVVRYTLIGSFDEEAFRAAAEYSFPELVTPSK